MNQYPYFPYGYPWWWKGGQAAIIGQALPSGLLKKIPTGPIAPSPQLPPPPSPSQSNGGAAIAVVRTPLGLDVYSEPRRGSQLAGRRSSHLFNNDSVIVYETDIVELGLPESSRARWWRISREIMPGVILSGFVRALDESGGYKLEPLTILPGRNVTQSLPGSVYRRPSY